MKELLTGSYTKEDFKVISKAFDLRNIAQYYVDKVIDTKESDFIMDKAPLFVNTSKDILSLKKEIETKIAPLIKSDFEVALSVASGSGKEHMALIAALLNIPVGIKLVAYTKNGVEFLS